MYRIESIVTSIILSYVDRYIKNFRRQDAQVSLWQGDGVFHNLDLDLEVLEQELNLPFSFVSGHINELLIHVPWTRIASEPVQITINTIECVMKLCPPGGRPAPPPERFRRQQSQPPDEQTPQSQSYKSSLVNKLICNLSITCNNFILKYVEEDIVLSMNIKNLSLSSVNEKWEPEITELSASSLILRKLISLSDVTICLDKRNASGRIESYMEPLLYRCFLTIRLSRLYASPTATKAMSTRMDVFCEKMAFTLSESQVPMLMRMFALALALHRKQLTPHMSQTSMADSNSETSADEHGADNNGGDDSWSTWVWSFVPSILPLSDDENLDEMNQSHTFHFGFYIDNFTLALKFCNVSIDLRGCLMELESHDSDWTNMQAGVSQITIEPSGDCCCGTSEQNQVPYLTAGSHQDSFLSGSLFGSTGTKVTERSWDYHLATVTETTLLEKTPAFAMDYLFSIEKQPYLEEDDEDYEERNKNPLERVLLRYVADHITVRVCSGVIHRTQMIMKAASTYDYSPYSTHYTTLTTVNENSSETEPPNLDDVKLVIPQHMTRFTLFHPTFEIYPANHSPVQPSALGRKLSRSKSRTHIPPVGLPTVCLVIKWDCLDAKLTRPLTPDKVKLLSAFKPTELTTEILNDSDTRFSFKAVGISSFLKMDSTETAAVINVLELNKLSIDRAIHNLACRTKSDVSTEIQVHIENFLLSFSKPKLLLTIEIINSLIMSNNRSRYQVSYNSLFNTSLVQDAAIVSDIVFLKLAMDKMTVKQVLTGMSESIQVCVNSCQGFAVQLTDRGQHKQTMILDAPNTNINTPLLTGIFQRPIEDSQHAPVLMFSLHGVRLSADPLIYSWLLYVPIQFPSAKTFHHPQFVSQTSVLTTTGSSSKGRRVSDGSLGSMMKRAPTPQESIHSSETRSAQLSSQQLVTESVVETTQPTLSEKITNLFPIWQTVVVSVDIADLSVYFPNNTLSSTLPQPMETDLQNALQSLSPPLHVAIFKVPSVTLRCASLKQSLVETRLPVIFPTAIWSPERSNFPWSLNISDLQCFTVHGGTQLQLLKPFSATCTVGVSTKYNNTALMSLALCVHLDTTAISIAISEEQVALLANLAVILAEVYQTLMPNWSVEPKHKEDAIFATDPVVGSEDSPSNSLPEEDQTGGSPSGPVKLTGSLQWTLARLTVSVYNNHQTKISPEKLKLTLDVEDIFISLDIEKVYHKLKLKIATASVQHYLRPTSKNSWEVGPFEGLVMRGHDPDGLGISTAPTNEENTPNSSGFLTATLTRAYCSNLHSKLATSAKTSKVLKKAVVEDRFITEIEVKLQPLDFVLSPTTLGTILNVLNPIVQLSRKKTAASASSPALRPATLTYFTSSSLPLLYLDLMAVRIVLCVSEKMHCHHDVVLIQFDSVSTNPQPENPLCRVPVRPDIYQAAEKHRILSVPGSEIEDRQYQLDVVGLSVSTGSWKEIRSMLVKDTVPILQNPALDWNEGRRPSSIPSALENLCSLIPSFNVCLVLAPAIIYQGNTIVCGHSTEVNAVSEITVALSVEQVELFGVLVRELIQILPKKGKDSVSTEPRLWFPDRYLPIKESLPYVSVHRDSIDSGVRTVPSGSNQTVVKDIVSFKGSMDLNTVSFTKGLSSISPSQSIPPTNSAFSLNKRFVGVKENSVPLEILITGSGLSCSIYSLVNGSKSSEIHPLLHMRISQPHAFLSKHGDTLNVQASIFDMSAKSGLTENRNSTTITRDKLSPKVFQQILIETRNGEPHVLTGIPPALLSVKWNRISTKPAKLDIDIGRPVRFMISLDSLNYVRDVVQKLACKWNPIHPAPEDELCDADANDDMDSGIKEESHTGYKTNYRKKYCSYLNVISVSTQKMIAAFLTENPDDGNVSLSVDGISLTTNLSQHSFSNAFAFRAVTVATQTEGKTKLLINPWSLSINVSLFWESWLQSPTLQIRANSDFLNINIAPDTLQCLKQVYSEYYNYYLKETSSNSVSQQTTSNYVIDQELEQEQHYKEDLQAGAFQFVDGGDDRDELPLTYQVVFWTGCHQNPTMAWRYPQPRALTRLFIQPLPFRDSQPGDKVDCCLQYWSECEGAFKDYISFSLCESVACTVALPAADPLPAVAAIWRVLLGSPSQCHQLPINVKALAACLRVDSCFCLSLIPRLQAAISLSSAKVSIWTEVNTMRPMPAQFSRYTCDGLIPSSHNVMIFSLCQTSTSYCKWKQGHLLITCDGKPRVDILNYRTLCMLCCVEPFRFTSRLSLSCGTSQSVNIVTEGVTCRIGPAICHTLSVTAQLWNQYSTSIPQHLIIMTPFVICNNSHLPIRFGQAETKEVISLQCMQCHLYSWFSTKSNLAIRFSLAQTNGCENWSKPVSLRETESQLISVCDEESRDWNLVITTRPISSFVTEVMISGQLIIQNTMDCDVELMVSCERQNSMVVPAKNTPPGIILSPHYAPFLRIRFPGISFTWSGQIPLKNDSETTLKQWLVKVPLRNKEEFNSIWCHLVWDSPNTSGRIFVMICSMYRISSLLPCGAYAHIETPELDSMKSAVIVGNGQVQDLVCPGTPENSHFLTFQLEGKTQPSSSKVPVSYSVIEPRLSAQNTKVINMNELIEKALSNEEPTNYPISGCTSAQWTSAGQQETVVLVKVDYSLDFVEPRSLQVEVSPWALLINSLGCHVCLQANNQIICSLPHLSVIAPPTIESTFHLGLYIGTAMYLSHPLQLARDLSFYMPHISGIIPLEGCINTTVDCGSIVSYVNIASIDMKGTRLLHVRASYVIANFSPWALKIVPLVVRRNQDDKGKQFCLPRNLDLHTITLQPQNPRAKQNKGHPLTEWLSVGVGDPEASFLSVSLGGDFSCPVAVPQTQERDSVPVLVPLSTPVQHINSSLLLCSEVKDGQTFITLWNQDWPQIIVHNHTTLTLALAKAKTDKGGAAEDYNPDWPWQLRLPPGCSADYHLPSCNEQLIQNGSKPSPMVVIAVVETSTDLVWSEAISLSPCRGRLLRLSGTSGFNVAVNNRGFTTHIVLSHMNHTEISPLDVRLRLMQESQINNDADSQRGNEEQSFKPIPRPLEMPAITNFEEPSLDKHAIESGNVKCISCPDKSCLPGLEDVTCFLQNITVIVGMESSSACDCREVAALIMDDIGFTIQPTKNPESEAKELLIRVTLGDIQFDNQEYSSGGYDFPVVLMIQPQEPSEPQHVEFSINGSALTLVEMSRTKGSALDLVMTVDVNSYRTPALQDASLTLKPFQIYVEDTYLIELKKILAKIVPTNSFCDVPSSVNKGPQHPDTPKTVAKSVASSTVTTEDHLTVSEAHGSSITTKQNGGAEDEERDEELFNVSEPEQDVPSFGLLPEKITTMYDILPFDNESSVVEVASNKSVDIENSRLGSEIYVDKDEAEEYLCNLIIPKEIIAAAQELAFPLRLRSLTISPLSVLVSLHTSTAFYIAIDHSPLNFSSFKRGSLVSTAYRLGHALTLHYFLGAFYGSAWALVSLELLGAPGGLARTVGSGMRDFVSLPYQGIQQGPRAFLLGIAHGSASLMKHVTAGTITSVTKLAASWARTLDRLTLDRNDLVLSEESRRHRPEGLTQGLMHGLSEFGIRLLGAVGSIVHQPLQYAISPNPDQSLANSIGLGVVGVFARPLSGAAELVARTGEGILSGAGWSSLPKSRNQSRSPHSHCSVEAVLKFSWKLLAPSEQIFFALEASSAENYESIVLLITRNHLHIIRMENGPVPFKSILLSELRISSHHSDPTLIVLTVVSPEVEAEELSRTRVAQFVRDCSRVVSEDTNVQLTNIPDSSHSFASEPSYSYFVNPEIREYFMTFINFVKRNSTNRDFSVIS